MCFNLNRARTCTHPRECNRPFGTRSTVGTTAAAPLRWGRARNGTRRLLSIRLFGTRSKARRNEATIRTRPRHRHPRCARNGKRPRGCTGLSGTRNTRGRLRLRRLRRLRRRHRLRCAKTGTGRLWCTRLSGRRSRPGPRLGLLRTEPSSRSCTQCTAWAGSPTPCFGRTPVRRRRR